MLHKDIIIIGGGISGLSALHYCRKLAPELSVSLIERDKKLGGTIGTENVDGYSFDKGPNGFLDREPLTLELCDDIGLSDKLERAGENVSKRFILRGGRLRSVPANPMQFLRSDILSLKGKIRLALELFVPAKKSKDDESIYSFASRRIGSEAADYLIQPMVAGIFGGLADKLSLKSCFPIMTKMESEHGSLIKAMIAKARKRGSSTASGSSSANGSATASGSAPAGGTSATAGGPSATAGVPSATAGGPSATAGGPSATAGVPSATAGGPSAPAGWLTSFKGGLYPLVETLRSTYLSDIVTGVSVEKIERSGEEYSLVLGDGSVVSAKQVIVALPSYVASTVLRGLSGQLADSLMEIPYAPIAVVCCGFKVEQVARELDGFGFLVPPKENRRILGSIWTSSIFSGRAPDSSVQFRTMIGGDGNRQSADLSENELASLALGDLREIMGLSGEPEISRVYRWKQGIPQYRLGHTALLGKIESSLDSLSGLYLTGNAYYGVGLNDCIKQSHRVVKSAIKDRSRPSLAIS